MFQTAVEEVVAFLAGWISSAPMSGAAPTARGSWLIVVADRVDGD